MRNFSVGLVQLSDSSATNSYKMANFVQANFCPLWLVLCWGRECCAYNPCAGATRAILQISCSGSRIRVVESICLGKWVILRPRSDNLTERSQFGRKPASDYPKLSESKVFQRKGTHSHSFIHSFTSSLFIQQILNEQHNVECT